MLLSIVIPVYNEADSLSELHAELSVIASDQNYAVEMILVDDGSTDDSWNGIRRLAETDGRVRGIRFRRNFGKAAALDAGFRAARGDRVMTLDADLQDDPIHIPEFLATIDQGYDVVSGWKQVRHDPWHKVGPSRIFNWMVSRLTGVALHDHNCGMKCYRREVLREVRLYGELHRFVPVLAAARGFRVGEIVVRHRPRRHGKSKYGLNRIVKGFLDLLTVKFLTGFGQRPQHLLGSVGLMSLLLGVLGMGYLALKWILSRTVWDAPIDLHETAALYYSLGLLLMGGQLLSVGILAELITSYLAGNSDAYSVAEHTPPRHETADDLEPSSHDA
ncbi:MAG: glycosyltransferase family 2 protein [Pirellulales bacterium]